MRNYVHHFPFLLFRHIPVWGKIEFREGKNRKNPEKKGKSGKILDFSTNIKLENNDGLDSKILFGICIHIGPFKL